MARVDYRNRRCEVTRLADSRVRVTRYADVLSEVRGHAALEAEVWKSWGTPDEEHPAALLIGQFLAPLNNTANDGSRILTRVFEELHATDETRVGELRRVTDENGREVWRGQFLQLASAPTAATTVGVTEAPGLSHAVLSIEAVENDGTLRRITRDYVEASADVVKVGVDEITRDENGRKSIQARFIQRRSADYVPPTPGDAYAGSGCVFSNEQEGGSLVVRSIVRRYLEVTAALTEIGFPQYSRGEEDRKTISRSFVVLPSPDGAEPMAIQGVIGVETFNGCVCSRADADQNRTRVLIRKTYIEATDVPAQIGDVIVQDLGDAGAFKGTPGNYKPARVFVYRYLVKGGSPNDALWLTLNTQFGATGRYYTGGGMVIRGTAYTVVQREYTELPSTYEYHVTDRYPFPGVIALRSDGVPYVSETPTTRVTSVRVVESYHLGEPEPSALGYDPQRWTSGTVRYVPSENNSGNLEGYDDYDFAQCLGTFGTTAVNKYYRGVRCSSIITNFSSVPAEKPSGMQCISSVPRRWRGQIWKRTDQHVTF